MKEIECMEEAIPRISNGKFRFIKVNPKGLAINQELPSGELKPAIVYTIIMDESY